MLRGVVDSNPDRVSFLDNGLLITRTLGVRWTITRGQGVHDAPYVIEPVCMENKERKGNQVCLFDHSAHLPLGDRLVTTVLGLLNDSTIAREIPQVAFAVAMLITPNTRNRIPNAALEQILQRIVHVAED